MSIISTPPNGHPFSRGFSTLIHVNDPEGWVRGKASLDTSTGDLTMVLGLETDSLAAGVRGRIKARVFDSNIVELAVVKLDQEIGIGGKSPGTARIEEFTIVKRIPAEVASRAVAIDVQVEFTGKQIGPFGFDIPTIVQAASVLLKVL